MLNVDDIIYKLDHASHY